MSCISLDTLSQVSTHTATQTEITSLNADPRLKRKDFLPTFLYYRDLQPHLASRHHLAFVHKQNEHFMKYLTLFMFYVKNFLTY